MNERLIQEIGGIVEKYKTIPIQKIANDFNINMAAKQNMNLIMRQLLKKELSKESLEFLNNDSYEIKTISLEKYGALQESISLPVFKYCDIVNETWETSTLRRMMIDKVFIFVVFRYYKGRDCRIESIIPWTMSNTVLDKDVKKIWEKTVECIRTGNIVKYVDDSGRRHTYFPAASESLYMHVRPHARNNFDTIPLPVADKVTGLTEYPKHSFWLNKNFVAQITSQRIKIMQFDRLQLTLLLGLYYIGKSRNIETFVRKFNVFFHASTSVQTILFELAKYKNIDPANNQELNTNNILHKQIWDDYISSGKIIELKDIYRRFSRGDFVQKGLNPMCESVTYDIEPRQNSIIVEDMPVQKSVKLLSSNKYCNPRSKEVLSNALQNAYYQCEMSCGVKLFVRKDGKTPYTEGHHLIPLEYQDYFEYSLDVEANIVSLCPNCHKLLHYGYDKEQILKQLYDKRIDRLKKCKLDLDFVSLLLMYR